MIISGRQMSSIPSTVLMVPPDGFQFNLETALSNAFQSSVAVPEMNLKAITEFTAMVSCLQQHGINVLILKQNERLPDAVFPNNWFSVHVDAYGQRNLVIYPMLAKNRQEEVNLPGLLSVFSQAQIKIHEIIDLRIAAEGFLEGTGSMVLDRENKRLYATLSPRTTEYLVYKVAGLLDYEARVFESVDGQNRPIYHTNVIMGIARHYVLICLDAIKSASAREGLIADFKSTNKVVITISQEQVRHMCGNVLELFNPYGESILVLSQQAYEYLTAEQKATIQRFSKLLPVDILTIETVGGGSARCMMAEIV